MDTNAPYNEIDYAVDCIITISKKITFSGRPDLNDDERVEVAKGHLMDEFGNNIEGIDLLDVYKL